VGNAHGGVILVGEGGAGKSTSALACLRSRLQFLGDDRCLVVTRPEPTVYSLYATARTYREDLPRFPFLEPLIYNPEVVSPEKFLYLLSRHMPEYLRAAAPLRAVLLPRVVGGTQTRLVPASAGEALRVLAPTTVFQWRYAGRRTFADLSDLFKRLPCYRLELGTDLTQIPQAISTLL
jgi:hypothetical protein